MDPNTCWEELQDLLAKYRAQKDRLNAVDTQDLVIHIEALDNWVSRGGFLPRAWCMNQTPEVQAAHKTVEDGLAEFNDEHPEFPGKRSIEGFYEAVRTLHKAGRIR